jgi:integrase
MSTTLDHLIETSLHLQDRTKELYRSCVAEFVAFAGPDQTAYTSSVVEEWLHSLLKTRKPQTVNVYRKAVRYASKRWAKQKTAGVQNINFAADVDKVKAPKSQPRAPLTYEEFDKLFATCASDELVDVRDRALMIMAFRTGLRRGGLCALEFDGIKPPKITTINKGGNNITFDADAETLAILEIWTDRLRELGVTSGRVFRAVRGEKIRGNMSPFQIWRVFNVRANQAKIRHVFPHLARHTLVTWLRENGVGPAHIRNLTGQTERTIEDVYSHVRSNGAVGDALPSLLGKGK